MARLELKGKDGKAVGMIDDRPKEKILFDLQGRRKGRYDKKQNVTFDGSGKVFGKGDLLLKLTQPTTKTQEEPE